MKLAAVSLLGTTLVFAGTSIYLARELGSTRDALAAESEARVALEARVRDVETRELPFDVGALAPQSADSPVEPVAPTPPSATPPSATPPPPPGPANANVTIPSADRARNASLTPAEQRQRRLGQETRLRARLADMPRDLQLDTATSDRLFDLLTDSQISAANSARAYAGDPAGAKAVADAARQERDAAINALLGPDKAAEFLSYEKSLPARMQVGRIDADMAASDVPLRDDQRKAMIAALAEVQDKHPQPARQPGADADYQVRFFEWQAEYSKQVQAKVEPLLTSEQRARYRDAVELQDARRESARARAEARARRPRSQ